MTRLADAQEFEVRGKTYYLEDGKIYDEDGEHIGRAPNLTEAKKFIEKTDLSSVPRVTKFQKQMDQISMAGISRLSKAVYKGMEYEITKKGKNADNHTPWVVYVEGERIPGFWDSVSEAATAARKYIDQGPQ